MTNQSQHQDRVPIEVIQAPWNIGLRPNRQDNPPGTWQAPQVLLRAGLAERLGAARVTGLPRPPYDTEPQAGTRIRNGLTLREHSLRLGEAVTAALGAGRMPIVAGGDCSVLLGCLVGARHVRGRVGLVHIDGHTDFAQPGDQMPGGVSSAAGIDLSLITGRGELLLTGWPGIDGPLVRDEDVVQIGDREGEAVPEALTVIGVEQVLAHGPAAVSRRALEHLDDELALWLHLDLDVLDQEVLPAVDDPGSPGLDYPQLALLLRELSASGRVLGLDITIYDPELDPGTGQAPAIVECIASGLTGLNA